MFLLSQYMRELAYPTPAASKRRAPGPVVIWNLVRRCNLDCKHCYAIPSDQDFAAELSTEEVCAVMDDLHAFNVPLLVFSGGEPMLRKDLFELARYAKKLGFELILSSNGTLIDARNIERIAAAGFDYVSISLDGMHGTHDAFRRKEGAFDASVRGIHLCEGAGVKVGVRFTLTRDNAHELPAMLQFVDDEGVDKFCLSHLNYAGRGGKHRGLDVFPATTRSAMDLLFDTCWDHLKRGTQKEFVTGNNDADGVYLLHWVRHRFPERELRLRLKLSQWGGNAAGMNVANIDNLGNVHPDAMWRHHSLGNVRVRKFSEIWRDVSDPLMAGLKSHPRPLKGRCAACDYLDICGGNTRVRAWQVTGDPWEEDPACYLTDEEIGLPAPRGR